MWIIVSFDAISNFMGESERRVQYHVVASDALTLTKQLESYSFAICTKNVADNDVKVVLV